MGILSDGISCSAFVVCNSHSDGPLDGLLKVGCTVDGPVYDGYFTNMARETCVSLSCMKRNVRLHL